MSASTLPLPPLKVAVGGRSATLTRRKPVIVHRQTHRTAGIAPLETRRDKYFIQAFLLACRFTRPEPGTTIAASHSPQHASFGYRRSCTHILDSRIGAGTDEHLVMLISVIGMFAVSPMYCKARSAPSRFTASLMVAGSGTRPSTATTISGEVPKSLAA